MEQGGDEEQQMVAAVNESVEQRAGQRLAKKRKTEVIAEEERERDRERSRKRPRKTEQDWASGDDRMDVDSEGSTGRMAVEE